MQADASNLKADVDRILQRLVVSADAAEQSVASLAYLDLGKTRMEEACSTLKVETPPFPPHTKPTNPCEF